MMARAAGDNASIVLAAETPGNTFKAPLVMALADWPIARSSRFQIPCVLFAGCERLAEKKWREIYHSASPAKIVQSSNLDP